MPFVFPYIIRRGGGFVKGMGDILRKGDKKGHRAGRWPALDQLSNPYSLKRVKGNSGMDSTGVLTVSTPSMQL